MTSELHPPVNRTAAANAVERAAQVEHIIERRARAGANASDPTPNRPRRESETSDSWRIVTTNVGRVVEASMNVAQVLNLTARALVGRDLLLFFPNERTWLIGELEAVAHGLTLDTTVWLRPRDRKPLRVVVNLRRSETGRVNWDITKTSDDNASCGIGSDL